MFPLFLITRKGTRKCTKKVLEKVLARKRKVSLRVLVMVSASPQRDNTEDNQLGNASLADDNNRDPIGTTTYRYIFMSNLHPQAILHIIISSSPPYTLSQASGKLPLALLGYLLPKT